MLYLIIILTLPESWHIPMRTEVTAAVVTGPAPNVSRNSEYRIPEIDKKTVQ